MKKVFSLLVATVMSLTMMVATASAADIDGIYGASAGEPSVTSISAPVGYIVEPVEPKDILRTYTTTEDNMRYTITIYCDFVTACVHDRTSDLPGAIMGYPCFVEDDLVISEFDFVTDIFGTL